MKQVLSCMLGIVLCMPVGGMPVKRYALFGTTTGIAFYVGKAENLRCGLPPGEFSIDLIEWKNGEQKKYRTRFNQKLSQEDKELFKAANQLLKKKGLLSEETKYALTGIMSEILLWRDDAAGDKTIEDLIQQACTSVQNLIANIRANKDGSLTQDLAKTCRERRDAVNRALNQKDAQSTVTSRTLNQDHPQKPQSQKVQHDKVKKINKQLNDLKQKAPEDKKILRAIDTARHTLEQYEKSLDKDTWEDILTQIRGIKYDLGEKRKQDEREKREKSKTGFPMADSSERPAAPAPPSVQNLSHAQLKPEPYTLQDKWTLQDEWKSRRLVIKENEGRSWMDISKQKRIK